MADILTNYVKFLRGTTNAYNALSSKDPDTLYFISEKDQKVGKLYLGDILVAGNVTADGTSVMDSLGELTDVNLEGLADKKVLGYDEATGKWKPMAIEDIFTMPEIEMPEVFVGASASKNGTEGLVPAPKIGDEGKYLRGDGTWATIETSSATQIFEADVEAGADHIAAITTAVGENAKLQNGDVAIVRELIANDKKQYTAYVYMNETWKAMDGNYNASNVFFDEDLTYTANIGALSLGDKNSKKIESTGKSLEQVLKTILAETKAPTINAPTYSLSASIPNSGASLEIGSYITTINWDGSYTDGTYSYGSKESTTTNANCKATYAMTNNKDSQTATTVDGSFTVEKIQIDSTSKKTYATVSGTCTYTASDRTPVNNIGDEVSGKLTGSSIEKSANAQAQGYRNTWYYVGEDCTTTIDSDFVRTKATAKNANTTSFGTVTIPAGTTRVFFAVLGDKTLKSCIDVDGMGLDVKDNFTKKTISIKGANNYEAASYSVFVAENANGMAATKFTPTIG